MYIRSVIIDGFKSYGRRTEIFGFDSEFTAITGLNGTGKSNILDAICFVLGISNLGQVRAASLQDLVYKSGQAGVTKATVTLVFDNGAPSQCPIGYEKCREISVTRQIVVGGKNKYLINGKNVQNKKVVDLFCSVQLNVNNPNFLIMQGRITKVLNMKPAEILSMIEEAAGTSMYESKKEATTKLIEKKDAKVRETNTMLKEEVEPKLEKLRRERSQYMDFQKICRDIEYLTRIHISFKYLKEKETFQNTEKNLESLQNGIENSKKKIFDNKDEIKISEKACEEIQHKIDTESGGALAAIEKELSKKSSSEAKATGEIKGVQANIEQEKKKLKSVEKNLKDDEKLLITKEAQMTKTDAVFHSLKEADENDAKAYADAQKKYEAVCQGLSVDEDGQAASLQDQLITARQQISEAQTVVKKSDMELRHIRSTLNEKKRESGTSDSAYLKDKNLHDKISKDIQVLNNELSKLRYEEGHLEQLEDRRIALTNEIRSLKNLLDRKSAYRYELQYQDPEPNFDRSKVHGMVGKLFEVKDQRDCLALTICAGGNLYSYVTDDDVTSKKILQKGQLQNRVSIMPINKLAYSEMNNSVIHTAQRLVGSENVHTALSLINFDRKFDPVMKYIFGRTLICKDLNIAKKVTYDRNVMCRSVTLDGDVVDPQGTLSGGSKPKGGNILVELAEIRSIEQEIKGKQEELNRINHEIASVQNVAKSFNRLKEKLDLLKHELEACAKRLAQTSFQQQQQEIEDLNAKIKSLNNDLETARETQKTATAKVKDIEAKLADAKGFQERELKAADDEMKAAKKKSEQSRSNWQKREQEFQTLRMEIEETKKTIEAGKKQVTDYAANIEELETKLSEIQENSRTLSEEVLQLKSQIKEQKDNINAQNKELKIHLNRKDKLEKQNQELVIEIKKRENDVIKVKNDNKDGSDRIANLEKKYTWIQEDGKYFGLKNTRYDYTKEDPIEAGRKLMKMQEQKTKMERNINLKAMMLLDREEEQYKETMRRKKIVEEDKEKIQNIICQMDEKKKEQVNKAWQEVNQNFGSIFGTLLPGAQACFQPYLENGNHLAGLEIRVGFNGVWKESLGELSGGQRSLVALSLVLAMLKFSPAPLYILDEVDAALDMSHTQNIGNMLKEHFTSSQFIIVSLKDGMFNNANVLFRTKFEEGFSAVTRTVNVRRGKK